MVFPQKDSIKPFSFFDVSGEILFLQPFLAGGRTQRTGMGRKAQGFFSRVDIFPNIKIKCRVDPNENAA
jgi:hypothetical protein